MQQFITGIQQAGIGVTNAEDALLLYKQMFCMDVLIFDDKAEALLMMRYTGEKVHSRRAILSMNLNGGGGFEIWQFISRTGSKPIQKPALGDLGIFAVKIKTKNVCAAHEFLSTDSSLHISPIYDSPDDRKHFWVTDIYGNTFNVVEGDEWFKTGKICGGVVGAVIGVSNMKKALHFYKNTLGINEVIYSGTASMEDVPDEALRGQQFQRVLLKKPLANKGAFSQLFGSIQIELIEAKDRTPQKIFANRYWGDCGFIHLCFDVLNMDDLKSACHSSGYQFTVDSADSFSMGKSAGRFCYVEDPDGTLIELVETHKVPILKKLGIYLNLKKRKDQKPLPTWMISLLGLNKVR